MYSPLINLTFIFFFFNDTATTEIYTLSLHDALPICSSWHRCPPSGRHRSSTSTAPRTSTSTLVHNRRAPRSAARDLARDRKSTRLNSSHSQISYAVFCLKKKKKTAQSYRA